MQKNLFNYDEKPTEPPKKIVYSGLNIHQKINYKANQDIFRSMVYKNFYYYFEKPLFQPIYTHLTDNYFNHYYLNAGSSNRIDNYRKSKQKNLFN